MARQFSYPEVAALEVGLSCRVYAPASEVKRKVAQYAARNNKRFHVANDGESVMVHREAVTDPEPEVA